MKQDLLSSLKPGETARLKHIAGSDDLCRRLRDLGWIPGTAVVCMHIAPKGSPRIFLVRGTMLALRLDACRSIDVVRSNC